jgi:biotin-(acetyl-CoA carboxylase) ligase
VAVVTALKPLFPNLPFRIKWPNDICISSESGGVKLGGVLCEASSSAERSFIIVGLGLNCAEAPALGTVNQQVGHLSEYASGFDPDLKVNADRVRGPIVDSLRFCFERLAREGKGWVSAEYQHLALFQEGTALTWSPFIEQGVVLGLGDLAELRVRSSLGEVRSLYSEEVKVRKIKPSVRDQIRGDEFLL